MMEVKHSSTVPLLDYVSANSDSNSAEASALLKTSKTISQLPAELLDDELLQNGTNLDDDLEFQDAVDDTDAINSDLEDALLADDDLLAEPKTNFNLENLDKAENSTDPGDDLDKLLSKINDVVEGSDVADNAAAVEGSGNENKTNEENVTKAEEPLVNGANKENMEEKEAMEVNKEKETTAEADENEDVVMRELEENAEENAKNLDKIETVDEPKKFEDEQPHAAEMENKREEEDAKEDAKVLEGEKTLKEKATTSEVANEPAELQESAESVEKSQEKTPEKADKSAKLPSIDEKNSATDTSLEECKIVEDYEQDATNKKTDDEIFTLVLDDDDDEDVAMKLNSAVKTDASKSDKKINEIEEIVCLDDDDDDEMNGTKVEDDKQEKTEESIKEIAPQPEEKCDEKAEVAESIVAEKVSENEVAKTGEVSKTSNEVVEKVDNQSSELKSTDVAKKATLAATTNELEKGKEFPVIDLGESDSEQQQSKEKVESGNQAEKANTTSWSKENVDKVTEVANKTQAETSGIQEVENSATTNEAEAKKAGDFLSDNTDNACDGLESAKTDAEKPVAEKEDDARSDSSASSLLEEGQAPSETGFVEGEEEDAECDGDDGDDVEILDRNNDVEKVGENENKARDDDTDNEIPPAKRLRLSVDSVQDENKSKPDEQPASGKSEIQEKSAESVKEKEPEKMEAESVESEAKEAATASLKRPLSATEAEDQKSEEAPVETALKKQKTNIEEPTTTSEEKSDLKPPAENASKPTGDEFLDVKQEPLIAVPSNKPIPLYPPPKFEETPKKLKLDFLQRFRKTFNQMTKNDLEELVLQKVVEALVYENQFADLRMIIEKQEKVIGLHRSKLAQLVKQYRDLEMVHTRVVKDMREKNSQYLMPVRITRAVGLQVSSPIVRKMDGPVAQLAPNNVASQNVVSSGIMRAPTQSIQQQQQQLAQQKRLLSPQRPASAGNNIMLPSSTTGSPTHAAAVNASSPIGAASTAAQAPQPVRRGCMQKVTAQRPVNGTNVSSSTNPPPMASIPASSYQHQRPIMPKPTASSSPMSADNTSRVLNKNASQALATVANTRMRYSGGSNTNINSPSPTTLQQAQQAKSQPQILNRQQGATNASNKISQAAQNKLVQQYRRSDSSPPISGNNNVAGKANSSTAYMEQYKNSFNQAMPTVSITPARPKDKSVIDLTDEDDLPTPAPPTMTPRARAPQQNQMNAGVSNRQNMPPSLTRMPSNVSVRPQIAARQLSSMQAQKQQSSGTITTVGGMSITRVAVNQSNPTAAPRLRYSHPAALPPTPPQTFNPGWKLPPPRPTIRISNLDNGIVISWTMEESLDRYAEVTTYQIYAYQETNAPPSTDSWRHVGDVKAMLLPMAVTLTQFQEDQRYFFSVRAIDTHQRHGPFSAPKTWN